MQPGDERKDEPPVEVIKVRIGPPGSWSYELYGQPVKVLHWPKFK